MAEVIDRFKGRYFFLSNFYYSPITVCLRYDGATTFPTVEHAYQAAKTDDIHKKRRIRRAETPGKAKRLGRSLELVPDWENIKVKTMEQLVLLKFTSSMSLTSMLLATGDAVLIEGNTWGDRFWGKVNGEGENHLGRILMEVRHFVGGPPCT